MSNLALRDNFNKIFFPLNIFILKIKSRINTIFIFSKIKNLVLNREPFNLLSNLVLSFITVREGQFHSESSDVAEHARWVEFISGLVSSRTVKRSNSKKVNGEDLLTLEDLLRNYYLSISLSTILKKGKKRKYHSVLESAKLFSLFVRGETYPSHFKEMGTNLYSEYDDWFVENLGFIFNEAFTIYESIRDMMNSQINLKKIELKKVAENHFEEEFKDQVISEEVKERIILSYWTKLYFGECEQFLEFSIDDLANFSGLDKSVCEKILNRLSHEPGYENKNYPRAFQNPFNSPWDFNTLYEKPILRDANRGKYLVPMLHMMPEILFNTFYYDLISDDEFWKTKGEEIYGKWLEKITTESLKKVFPEANVFQNPFIEKGKELCDVIVLFDRKIFIVQCKTKKLVYESRMGIDFNKFKTDINKGIVSAFLQALKAKDFLLTKNYPILYFDTGQITIDESQISEVFLVCVTLHSFQNLTTRLANLKPELDLSNENQYPWAISLFDLKILCEILNDPYLFIQYARRRLLLEKTDFQINGDEIDMLGLFLDQGLYLFGEDFKGYNAVSFSGYSDKIDEYFFNKYETKKNQKKPKPNIEKEVQQLIEAIKKLNQPYKTDCIIRILDMGSESRIELLKSINICKKATTKDKNAHDFSLLMENNDYGISFVSMDTNGDLRKLSQQLTLLVSLKKYEQRCNEWVGLGWDSNSKRELDLAIFLSGNEIYDPIMERLVKENLKPGRIKVNLKKVKAKF